MYDTIYLCSTMASLAEAPRAALLELGYSSVEQVLKSSDSQLMAQLRNSPGIGPRAMKQASTWLQHQRDKAGHLTGEAVDIVAQAERLDIQMRLQFAQVLTTRIREFGLLPADIAEKARTNEETVRMLMSRVTPPSFDVLFRVATAIGAKAKIVGALD